MSGPELDHLLQGRGRRGGNGGGSGRERGKKGDGEKGDGEAYTHLLLLLNHSEYVTITNS